MNLLKDGYGLGALLHSSLAKQAKALYPKHVQQKAVGLALVGYNYQSAYSPLRAFFVRNISMHSHISMAKLERDIFICASFFDGLSTNPFQLCHLNYLVVIGKALLIIKGVHNHA